MPKPAHEPSAVADLLQLIDASPTPYHAVAEVGRRLEGAGFQELSEAEPWRLEPGSRFYVVRGGSSLAAMVVGEKPASEAGFCLIGAHTDSPNLRVKPEPDLQAYGYRQLVAELYGGVLWSTWLDRDLSIAGRVVVDDGSPGGRVLLVNFERPLLRIPNLAIHLNRAVNSDGLKLNPQTHLVPIMALEADREDEPGFRALLALELARGGQTCAAEQILGYDLCLYDAQKSAIVGLNGELISASRLDNLASCHAALRALTEARSPRAETRGIVLYDHEEVGSQSAQGADSTFLGDTLLRVASAGDKGPDALARAVARSLLISADMAHAVHPNYPEKHEPNHRPVLGKGPVIKTNVAQSYATDAESDARFRRLCKQVGVTPQHFVSRSDQACGSTIGPITAGRLGLRTVDVGNPLLAMHSIRETAAVADVDAMCKVLAAFFA